MRECKIGVGGCGGKIYKSFLAYSDKLVGPVLKNMSNIGAEKKLVERGEKEWKPLFSGLWLDLDGDEVAGLKKVEERDENAEYHSVYYYLYNGPDVLTDDLAHKMANLIGCLLDAPGFMHRPELQMIAFANPEISKAICSKIYASFQRIEFDSLFFFVGLGGGTGTGVIGNLAGYIMDDLKTMQASFVLGVLSGKMDARKDIRIQATFFRRSFNAIWALSDLVGGKKVACVMLMDNDKLSELGDVKEGVRKLEKRESENDVVNRQVVRSFFPLLGKDELEQIDESRLREELAVADFTPIIVPCYWHGKENMEDLVVKAISEGTLAECDHTTADGAWVFTKGFMEDIDAVKNAVKKGLETAGVTAEGLKVWRTKKVGGAHKDREVLILLKNPGIKELLSERIDLALDFIRLIEIVEKVETGSEDASSLDTLAASLKESIEDDTEGKQLLARIEAKINEFVDKSKIEQALIRVITEAWVFSHSEKEFKFTEEVIESRGRFIGEFKEELEKVKERIEKGEKHIFPKHVKIDLHGIGYLFSIAAKFCWSDVFTAVYEKEGLLRFLKDDHNIDWAEEEKRLFPMPSGTETELNKGTLSEELKNEFKEHRFSLPEEKKKIKITKDNADKWWIADEEKNNTYLIRKEAEKLNIYKVKVEIVENGETIRITNKHKQDVYAEITLLDNDKKAILTTCDGKISKTHNLKVKNENGKLNIYDEDDAQLLKFLEEKSKLLFSMPIGLEEKLNKDTASEELKEVFFTEEGVRLSTKNNITPEKGNKWSITDEDKTYFIRKEPEYLNIFEFDNDEPLFRINIGLEAELNKDTVTEKLKNAFPTKEVSLSMNSKITKENGDKWVITDEENQKTYNIRKEPEYLNVYNSYNGVISNEFKAVFVKHKVPISDNDIVTREDVNEWAITSEKKKYIIKKMEAEKLNIYEQEIPLEHRVSILERRFDDRGF